MSYRDGAFWRDALDFYKNEVKCSINMEYSGYIALDFYRNEVKCSIEMEHSGEIH